jgi:hypothetical protein
MFLIELASVRFIQLRSQLRNPVCRREDRMIPHTLWSVLVVIQLAAVASDYEGTARCIRRRSEVRRIKIDAGTDLTTIWTVQTGPGRWNTDGWRRRKDQTTPCLGYMALRSGSVASVNV